MLNTKAVITIATGKKYYIDLANTLAASFLYWNNNSNIKFYLVTDNIKFVDKNIIDKINIIEVLSDEITEGFSSKLHLDKFIYADEMLFIDSDCIIYGDVSMVFDQFSNHNFSAIGFNIYDGINIGFLNNVKKILSDLDLDYYPLICGSIYYYKNTELTKKIFEYARKLYFNYDQLGLIRLRGKENEEPLLALSMSYYSENVIPDDGYIKADRMFYQYNKSDVLSGTTKLWVEGNLPVPEYSKRISANPIIIHYNADYADTYEYISERKRLEGVFIKHRNIFITQLYIYVLIIFPTLIKNSLKNLFRPLYKLLFGYRKIKQSERL